MQDSLRGGGDPQHPPVGLGVPDGPKVLVATTVAALLLAGSAYVWRKGSGAMNLAHVAPTSQGDTTDRVVSDTASRAGQAKVSNLRASASGASSRVRVDDRDDVDDADNLPNAAGAGGKLQDASAGSFGKSSRAKERRRRGKDPLKELMKPGGGKLAKMLKATDYSTSAFPSNISPSSNPSDSHRLGSTSRQSEKSRSEDPSTSPKGSSSIAISPSPSISDFVDDSGLLSPGSQSPYSQPLSSRFKSRSRSRPRNTHDHESSSSNTRNNSDAVSTISSACSSTTTEATTFSSTSTTPSSYTSLTNESADLTPNAEFGPAPLSGSALRPISSSCKSLRQPDSGNPWDWGSIGAAGSRASSIVLKPWKSPRPKALTITDSSGTEGTPIPYASVVSAKLPVKGVSRSTFGSEAKEEPGFLLAEGDEEEVAPLVFPSLNNPAPDSSFSVGRASTSSFSRPHSRASSSSAASSSNFSSNLKSLSLGPGRNGNLSNLAPFTPPLGSGSSQRRDPTPRELDSGTRPTTPGTASCTDSPLLSGSAPVPPSPSSQTFAHSLSPSFQAASSTFAVSAQTQVASLRGALEASRLREQKQKEDFERVTKERNALQWENAAWRRREGELQAQIQQMMHQFQAYAAYSALVNQGQHPPAPTASHNPATSGSESVNVIDVDDANVTFVSMSRGEESYHATAGGSNTDGEINGSGMEGSTVANSSVPCNNVAKNYGERGNESVETMGNKETLAVTGPQHRPPVLMHGLMPHGNGGLLSPSIMHSPTGVFPHYPLHATQPVGFGLHGHPLPSSPMPFPFYNPPLPQLQMQQQQHQHQQHPFSPSLTSQFKVTSGPQSPVVPHGMMMNPFVVNSTASVSGAFPFHRPGTPGGSLMMMNGAQQQQHGPGVPPHPHPLNGYVGIGMGVGGGASPFAMGSGSWGGGGSVESASPDLTGSPSSTTEFSMQERGRRSGSGGMSLLIGGGMKRRGSVLPAEHGIGRRNGDGGKSSSGSGSENDGKEDDGDEDEGVFNVLLADAILKRPESINMGKGSFRGVGSEAGFGLNGGIANLNGTFDGIGDGRASGVVVPARETEDGASPDTWAVQAEEGEGKHRELSFPSLSDRDSIILEERSNGAVASHPQSSPPGPVSSPSVESPSTILLATLQEEHLSKVEVVPDVFIKTESAPSSSDAVMPGMSESVSEH